MAQIPATSPLCLCYINHYNCHCGKYFDTHVTWFTVLMFMQILFLFFQFSVLFLMFVVRNLELFNVYCDLSQRQQVTMTEQWAAQHKEIHFSSMHPGWADTPGGQHVFVVYISCKEIYWLIQESCSLSHKDIVLGFIYSGAVIHARFSCENEE